MSEDRKKEWYWRNREKVLEKRKVYNRTYHVKNRDRILERKRELAAAKARRIANIKVHAGCVDCGYRGHPAALDFDHIDTNEKLYDVSDMTNNSWDKIESEINKCEVRCANCHRIKTWEQKGFRADHQRSRCHDYL